MRIKRVALTLFIILLVIPSLYWIPVNLFLMAGMIPQLASEGEGKSFNVNYTGAWSFTPGILHVRGLHLDGTDPNVRWDVKIESAVLHHSLKALMDRQVLVNEMNAEGVWVKIRQHLETEKAAVLEKLGPSKPEDPNALPPWLLSIHGIQLKRFHHAEMDAMIFNGDSEIDGDFILHPGRNLEIKPSEWKITQGVLTKGDSPIFTEMKAISFVTIHPTDLKKTHGSEVFNTMDITHALDAKVLSPDFFGLFYFPYQDKIKGHTEGDVDTRIEIKRGVFQVGSSIQSNLTSIHLALKNSTVETQGQFKWNVIERKKKPVAVFSVPLKNARWKKDGRVLASVSAVNAQGSATHLSLLDLFSDVEVSVKSEKIRVIPIQDLFEVLSEEKNKNQAFKVDAGELSLSALFKAAIKRVTVDLGYSTPRFEVTYNGGKTKLIGKLKTQLGVFTSRVKGYQFELGKTFSDLQSISIVNAGQEEYKAENWKIDLALEGGKFATEPLFHLDGGFQIKMTDLKMPIRFIVPDSFFVKLGTAIYPMRNFSGAGDLHIDRNEIGLREFKATTSNGPIHGALIASEAAPKMAFMVSLGLAKLCLKQKPSDPEAGIHMSSKVEECEEEIKSYNERRN